jgi:triosephosphate isomerase (TIM)
MTKKILVVGNWKMNQSLKEIESFFNEFLNNDTKNLKDTTIGFAPQFIHLPLLLQKLKGSGILVGSQNSSHQLSGAFTGECSPQALKELGCDFTIIGHSERRAIFGESYELLKQKIELALKQNLKVIFCIGETLEEREQNRAKKVVEDQLLKSLSNLKKDDFKNVILAYEPVWAIGTGKTASPADANEMHQFIKELMLKSFQVQPQELTVLYGGSVKASNAKELFNQSFIDGGLVGGASLNPQEFAILCKAQ